MKVVARCFDDHGGGGKGQGRICSWRVCVTLTCTCLRAGMSPTVLNNGLKVQGVSPHTHTRAAEQNDGLHEAFRAAACCEKPAFVALLLHL